MWTIARITNSDGKDTCTFAAIRGVGDRAFVIGDVGSVVELQAALLDFIKTGATATASIEEHADAFGLCWESAGQAQRRYGFAKSTARYRAANDGRCRKAGGGWECPAAVWKEYAG